MHLNRSTLNLIKSERLFIIVWSAFFAFMLLYGADHLSLWDQDEAAYAGFAHHMAEGGSRVIPVFPWSEIHRKPPLQFWLTAAMFKVWGAQEWVVRVVPILAVGLLPLIMFLGLRNILHREVALWSAIITGSTLLIPVYGKIAFVDGLLLFFCTVCLVCLIRITQRDSLRDVLIFWFAMSAALLVKGPPVLIITGTAILVLVFFEQGRKTIRHLQPWWGYPLALLPFALWVVATIREDGGLFAGEMLDWYVLQRIGMGSGTAVLDTWSGPPGYYLVIHLFALIPWIWLFPAGIRLVRQMPYENAGMFATIIAWLAGSWLVWEALPSKLPSYTLAAHPMLAIVLAWGLHRLGSVNNTDRIIGVLGALLAFLLSLGLIMGLVGFAGPAMFVPAVVAVIFFWAPLLLGTIAYNLNEKVVAFRLIALGTVLFSVLVWTRIVPSLEPARGVYKTMHGHLAEMAAEGEHEKVLYRLDNPTRMPSFMVYAAWNNTLEWFEEEQPGLPGNKDLPLLTYNKLMTPADTLDRTVIREWPGWISDRNLPVRFYLLSPVRD